MIRRYLVIGGSGLVGEHLVRHLSLSDENPIVTYLSNPIPTAEHLDICDAPKINEFLERFNPEIVFLPAALTNVDFCEKDHARSYQINVRGVKNVVNTLNKIGGRLIYFSTDYIFDGTTGPYGEDSTANPISEYGRQKLEAEHYIALTSLNYLIIRTTVVYGWERQGKNFVYRLVNSLRDGITVKVPSDQLGTPTYAPELAKSAVSLSMTNLNGVVNVAGSDCISRYEFALKVARTFKLESNLIVPVPTIELNQAAKRPLLAGLRIEKAARLLNTTFLSSDQGLNLMLEQNS